MEHECALYIIWWASFTTLIISSCTTERMFSSSLQCSPMCTCCFLELYNVHNLCSIVCWFTPYSGPRWKKKDTNRLLLASRRHETSRRCKHAGNIADGLRSSPWRWAQTPGKMMHEHGGLEAVGASYSTSTPGPWYGRQTILVTRISHNVHLWTFLACWNTCVHTGIFWCSYCAHCKGNTPPKIVKWSFLDNQ